MCQVSSVLMGKVLYILRFSVMTAMLTREHTVQILDPLAFILGPWPLQRVCHKADFYNL